MQRKQAGTVAPLSGWEDKRIELWASLMCDKVCANNG
jgi:hypothetical protein